MNFQIILVLLTAAISADACVVTVDSLPIKLGPNQTQLTRTRNTIELNILFARINSGNLPCHNVEFPEGVIEINGTINVFDGASHPPPVPSASGAYAAITIFGVNREHSIIMQTAPNHPVFRWNSNNLYVTGISVHDLGFDNLNTQFPYNSEQWGLEFRCTADGSAGNSWGFANSQFERLSISHMYVGLGLYTAKGGACGLWSTHLQDLKFYNSQRAMPSISLAEASASQPTSSIASISCRKTIRLLT